jgi:pimeloyl-ACP methyl ester carboxylesterase
MRFHGLPGCRLFSHPDVDTIRGVRLLVLERPGLGLSTSAPSSYSFLDWSKDVREFTEARFTNEQKLSIIGYSAGGPFALVTCLFGEFSGLPKLIYDCLLWGRSMIKGGGTSIET